jgi:hypothetical protein
VDHVVGAPTAPGPLPAIPAGDAALSPGRRLHLRYGTTGL